MRRVAVMICLISLTGCGTKWSKPGASEAEFEGTKASCASRAYSRFQPVMQSVQIGSGYTTPLQTQCFGTGYNVQCTSTGGQYTPPASIMVDQNNNARSQDVRSCLFEQGWTPNK